MAIFEIKRKSTQDKKNRLSCWDKRLLFYTSLDVSWPDGAILYYYNKVMQDRVLLLYLLLSYTYHLYFRNLNQHKIQKVSVGLKIQLEIVTTSDYDLFDSTRSNNKSDYLIKSKTNCLYKLFVTVDIFCWVSDSSNIDRR